MQDISSSTRFLYSVAQTNSSLAPVPEEADSQSTDPDRVVGIVGAGSATATGGVGSTTGGPIRAVGSAEQQRRSRSKATTASPAVFGAPAAGLWTPESWQQHREEAHRLLEAEEPQRQGLRQDLRLLRGRRLAARAALELRGAVSSLSAAAEAELQLEMQPALRLAAALLRQQGDLPGVQYKEEVVTLPRCYLSGMSMSSHGTRWEKDKALLLETSTKFVRFTSRLYCCGDPAWSLALLHRHSTTLTYLRLDYARLEHIAAVWELTALEELEISIYEAESQATETHSGQPLQWPPLGPSKARRLWRVMKFSMPWSVAAVLLAAHRDSLLDVYMWPRGIHMTSDQLEATAAILRQCDMYRLRSIDLAFVELTEEEADVLRAALPEGCHLGYRVKVDKPPARAPPKQKVQPDAGLEEVEDDLDIGLGLFD